MADFEARLLPSEVRARSLAKPVWTTGFYRLPPELLLHVLSYFGADAVRRTLRLVDRYFAEVLTHDDQLWRGICIRANLEARVYTREFDRELWHRCKPTRLWPCRSSHEWLYWSERPKRCYANLLGVEPTDTRHMVGIGRGKFAPNDVRGESIYAGEWLGTVAHGYGREWFRWPPAVKIDATHPYVPVYYEGPFAVHQRQPGRGGVLRFDVSLFTNVPNVFSYTGDVRADDKRLVPVGIGTFINVATGTRFTRTTASGPAVTCARCSDNRVEYRSGRVQMGWRDRDLHWHGPVIVANVTGGRGEEHYVHGKSVHLTTIDEHHMFDQTIVDARSDIGHGTMINATTGGKYTGEMKRGVLHGKGRLVGSEGTIFDGSYVNGQPCGELIATAGNGDVVTVAYVDGKRHGVVSWHHTYDADGDETTGMFENGALTHYMQRRRGIVVYDGECKDFGDGFRYHGAGTFQHPVTGVILRGTFDDGGFVAGEKSSPDGTVWTAFVGRIQLQRPSSHSGCAAEEPPRKRIKITLKLHKK